MKLGIPTLINTKLTLSSELKQGQELQYIYIFNFLFVAFMYSHRKYRMFVYVSTFLMGLDSLYKDNTVSTV